MLSPAGIPLHFAFPPPICHLADSPLPRSAGSSLLQLSKELGLHVKDVLDPAFAMRVAEMEVKRREAELGGP